jgi:NADPH:quinone reductase-like Zn-dependent oxidoreductase
MTVPVPHPAAVRALSGRIRVLTYHRGMYLSELRLRHCMYVDSLLDLIEYSCHSAQSLDMAQDWPYIRGNELAGTVVAVGLGVENLQPDDRIITTTVSFIEG